MKKLLLSAVIAAASVSAYASVTIHYDNKDANGYFMKVKIDGVYKEIKIESGKSAYITIQGNNSACVFETRCGEVEVNTGDNITVENRCISVYKSLQQNYRNW
jgi:hypothetical protein